MSHLGFIWLSTWRRLLGQLRLRRTARHTNDSLPLIHAYTCDMDAQEPRTRVEGSSGGSSEQLHFPAFEPALAQLQLQRRGRTIGRTTVSRACVYTYAIMCVPEAEDAQCQWSNPDDAQCEARNQDRKPRIFTVVVARSVISWKVRSDGFTQVTDRSKDTRGDGAHRSSSSC